MLKPLLVAAMLLASMQTAGAQNDDVPLSVEITNGQVPSVRITANADTTITGIIFNKGHCLPYFEIQTIQNYIAGSRLPAKIGIGESWVVYAADAKNPIDACREGVT